MPEAPKIPEEPKRRGARVRDKDGDTWRRGTTRWNCEAAVDGVRVTRAGRLPWVNLVQWYGPLEVIDLNDRPTRRR
jgi:hypothetical protein